MSALAETPTAVAIAGLIAPDGDRERWIAERRDGALIALGSDAAQVLRLLDGTSDAAGIARRLGARWTPQAVDHAVQALCQAGLASTDASQGEAAAPARARRLRFAAPASLQLTILDERTRLNALRGRASWCVDRRFVAAELIVGALGLILLGARGSDLTHAATTPLPLAGIALVGLLTVFLTSLHELAHGLTLLAYGGRVRRLGVMVFYTSIAFFCDVTDAWTLGSRKSARNVALAGGVTSLALAGLASLGSCLASGTLGAVLLLVAALTYAASVLNLIPFVKFDGYVALVLARGASNLRRSAMDAWVDRLAGRRPSSIPQGWSAEGLVAFGLCCSAFPLLLVGVSAWQVSGAFSHFGRVGAALDLGVTASIAAFTLRQGIRFVRRTAQRGLPRVLAPAVIATVTLAIAGAGISQRGESAATLPFVLEHGRLSVIVDDLPAGVTPRSGETIRLTQTGLLGQRTVGQARFDASPAVARRVPAQVLVPSVRVSGTVLRHTVGAVVVGRTSGGDVVGEARIDRGRESVAGLAVRQFITDPLASITGD